MILQFFQAEEKCSPKLPSFTKEYPPTINFLQSLTWSCIFAERLQAIDHQHTKDSLLLILYSPVAR